MWGLFFWSIISHDGMSLRHSLGIVSSPLRPQTQSLVSESVCVYRQCTGSSQVLGVYVSLVMLRQVVAPHEAFLTLAALEALVSCGGDKVTG